MSDPRIIVECAFDLLSGLRNESRLTTAIATLAENETEGIVLESFPGSTDHSYVPRVGFQFPLHSTAPGKALLTYLPPSRRRAILKRLDYKPFTSRTYADSDTLEAALVSYEKLGYVPDISEYVEGVNCVGCAVLDDDKQPIASVWMTALAIEFPEDEIPKLAKTLKSAVNELQLRLRNASATPADLTENAIKRGRLFIEQNYLDKDVIEKFLSQESISYNWFRKLFKEKYDIAPTAFRRELLHERAQRLLINTSLSVKEISIQLCYESQNYFSRAFKRMEGVSPENYRKQHADAQADAED